MLHTHNSEKKRSTMHDNKNHQKNPEEDHDRAATYRVLS